MLVRTTPGIHLGSTLLQLDAHFGLHLEAVQTNIAYIHVWRTDMYAYTAACMYGCIRGYMHITQACGQASVYACMHIHVRRRHSCIHVEHERVGYGRG